MNWRFIGFSSIFLCVHLLVWSIGIIGAGSGVSRFDTYEDDLTAEGYMATGRALPLRCLDPYSASLIPQVSFNVKRALLSRREKWNKKQPREYRVPFLIWLQSIKGVGPKTAVDLQKFISSDPATRCPPYFDIYQRQN